VDLTDRGRGERVALVRSALQLDAIVIALGLVLDERLAVAADAAAA
jgi:hypothetical protein